MPNQPPLNPDALEAAAKALEERIATDTADLEADGQISLARRLEALAAVSAYLAVAQSVVNSAVEAFINQRPEYVTVLKNTRSGDDMSDYCRWQGHAEARRQLAQKLGWAVPHNPGETTRPVVDDA